jgi:serine/threonine protein kinase
MRDNELRVLNMLKGRRNVPDVVEALDIDSFEGRPALIVAPAAHKVHPVPGGMCTNRRDYVQLVCVLQQAHALGLCHRDVKPENIFKADGTVTLNDWGSAAATGEEVVWTGTEPLYSKPPRGQKRHRPHPAEDLVALVRSVYLMYRADQDLSRIRSSPMWSEALDAAEALNYTAVVTFFSRL